MQPLEDEDFDDFFRIVVERCIFYRKPRGVNHQELTQLKNMRKRRAKKILDKWQEEEKVNQGEYGFGSVKQQEIRNLFARWCEEREYVWVEKWDSFLQRINGSKLTVRSDFYHAAKCRLNLTAKGEEYYRERILRPEFDRQWNERIKADEERLLSLNKAAADAKKYAESNPDDALSWLKLAKAMDEANLPDEAEFYRKKAIDLV